MPRRKTTAPTERPPAGSFFGDIPAVIAEQGRAKGFESLRDRVLGQWEVLTAMCNAYSLLKLAIEADRHAMFSEVAEAKAKGVFDRELWERYQDYLHGNVDVVPDANMPGGTPPPSGTGLPDDTTLEEPEEEDADEEDQ